VCGWEDASWLAWDKVYGVVSVASEVDATWMLYVAIPNCGGKDFRGGRKTIFYTDFTVSSLPINSPPRPARDFAVGGCHRLSLALQRRVTICARDEREGCR
jgi:hypothetical protein